MNSFYLLQSTCQLQENIFHRLLILLRFLLPMKPFLHKIQDRGDELHLICNTDEHRLNWKNKLSVSFKVFMCTKINFIWFNIEKIILISYSLSCIQIFRVFCLYHNIFLPLNNHRQTRILWNVIMKEYINRSKRNSIFRIVNFWDYQIK